MHNSKVFCSFADRYNDIVYMESRNNIKVFISSTVYNFEDVLENVYALLDGYGYDVYLSKKGTIPLDSNLSNVHNCEIGVGDCDVFVGFIRPYYGSGILEDGVSITEKEFNVAFERNLPRFILSDQRVSFTRRLLEWLQMEPTDIPNVRGGKQNKVIDGRCVALYNRAISNDVRPVSSRIGNWVQDYYDWDDIRIHLEAQFKDVERVRKLIDEDDK